jgi:glutamine transport system substrate-binding protein
LIELKNGGVDAIINDQPVNDYYIKLNGAKDFKEVGAPLSSEYYGIAIPKTKPDLKTKINDGLKKIKADGTYAKLYNKYFGQNPPAFLPGEEK